jgi:serine/threonine-protein kinase
MIGKTISRYKILDKIGEGGMGVVYRAEDTELQRPVALKFLPRHLLANDEERARFLQEARAAAALDHPNICTIYEIATVDDESFIAMAYIAGEELGHRIGGRPMPLDDAVTFGLEIAEALHEAHSRGVVHRDIKPSNVIINDKGRAILMDFGLAKLHGQTRITQAGTTLGTVAYMSPEQARGEDVDQRSDIWSLGVMLYEMIAGHAPFRGEHQSAVIYAIANDAPPPLTSVRSDVPMELERIANKALAKDPAVRYQHVDEMAVDLRALRRRMRGESDPSGQSVAGVTPASSQVSSATPAPSVGTPASSGHTPRRFFTGRMIGLLVVVIAAGAFFVLRGGDDDGAPPVPVATEVVTPEPTVPAVDQNSLAVLPLDNLSGDEANEFFVDGMTEELITQLARIRALKVISRTSIMRYKDSDKPLTTIAGELGVAKILEGSVMWAGERVRISAQLIDGTNDAHLWANSYEADLSDVLGLQRQVARAVADEIQLELTPQEEAELATAPIVDGEAHQLYLQGRYLWHQRGGERVHRSIRFFEKAIAKDPNYAAAYAAMAEAYLVLPSWDPKVRPTETYRKVGEYAEKALEMDATLASAHAALAGRAWDNEWDWEKGERLFKRAIEVNPNYASAYQWYAEFLVSQGRVEEARARNEKALEFDPLSIAAHGVAIWIASASSRPELARSHIERFEELHPGHPLSHNVEANVHYYTGDRRAAEAAWVAYLQAIADDDDARENARQLRAALDRGLRPYYEESLRQHMKDRAEGYIVPSMIATTYAGLGDVDSVVVWLERGIEERDGNLVHLADDPRFDPYRSDPRFQEIIRHLNLEAAEDRFMKIRGRASM